MGSFLLLYGRKCYTTIQPKATIWPIVSVYQIQSNEDILPNTCLLSQFSHQIEDDKMSYELTEYQDKKILLGLLLVCPYLFRCVPKLFISHQAWCKHVYLALMITPTCTMAVCTLKKGWGCGSIVVRHFYYPTRLDKRSKGGMEEWRRSVGTYSKATTRF